ncbi:DNA phosphorothioation-dependent restriction protein DptG [Anaerobacterium chartisolvens]|uniref:DNA phosphorothioation-dependent restriction protein DptG n=1 Tax=Anaerobacterium chartisolvens TaxID=1297424 RepID=A0A369ARY4_9FIRM|nr:DNA phosphorothioation-dependent restriction protein DptG [Anaerobacterium chartisolvens]RCX12109.1 DNA phosphorothioation-dependent restriction protein DptG [Anaerobacterium chartisolvens]
MFLRLNIDEILKNFNFNKEAKIKLQHNTGNKIRILPFRAKFEEIYIANFKSVTGELSRIITSRKLKDSYTADSICNHITKNINIENEDEDVFRDLVKELFFNKFNELEIFHPIIYNYVTLQNTEHKKIASFLNSVLVNEEIKHVVMQTYDYKPKNIMLGLILESLPELLCEEIVQDENYINYLPFVQTVFIEDLKFMLSNEKLYVEYFEEFIKYYFFFYVSQISLKLNQMFNSDISRPDPLFFTLEGEKISKSRTSYGVGWNLLSGNIANLFSHAICLEFLNHTVESFPIKLSYVNIAEIVKKMNTDEKQCLQNDIDQLLSLYKDHIQDIDWESFNLNYIYYDDDCLNKIYELLRAIEYQFARSIGNRKSANQKYSKWFEDFCRKNFLKSHGPLGFTLSLTQEYLILITRLCMNNKDKIGLKSLFLEYERRGLFLDSDSKDAVIQLFDKLNILEKKSDSGDAQYVKAVL